MKVIRTKDFEKAFENLPASAQRFYRLQETRFLTNWKDGRLHLKKVHGLKADVFSLRVTRRYRALFYFQDQETAIFFIIDHRKDIYR